MPSIDDIRRGVRPLLADLSGARTARDERAAWFDALSFRQEADRLVVAFPHSYFARWFRAHKKAAFESALYELFPDCPPLVYEDAPHGQPLFPKAAKPGAAAAPGAGEEEAEENFARFIVNARNAFPLATAEEFAQSAPLTRGEDLLVFCGRSGTGKSHLLKAMAAALGRRFSRGRVLLRRAAPFCAEREEKGDAFDEAFWRDHDALLLDDVQEVRARLEWQRILAVCMDICRQRSARMATAHSGPLLVFAHAGPACDLARLEERLRNRLQSGLVLELLEPDLDVRLRYIKREVADRHLPLDRDQMVCLARRCAQFSLLTGILRKIEAFATLHGRAPLKADLENIIRTGGTMASMGCREILASVARAFNLQAEDVMGSRRQPELVLARQVAMYVCRRRLGLSYPELGRAFGGRDHSTVIHAVKKVRALVERDKDMHSLVTELENSVP